MRQTKQAGTPTNAGPGSYYSPRSTQESFDDIAGGFDVCMVGGPFETREQAHYALELAWESPE